MNHDDKPEDTPPEAIAPTEPVPVQEIAPLTQEDRDKVMAKIIQEHIQITHDLAEIKDFLNTIGKREPIGPAQTALTPENGGIIQDLFTRFMKEYTGGGGQAQPPAYVQELYELQTRITSEVTRSILKDYRTRLGLPAPHMVFSEADK